MHYELKHKIVVYTDGSCHTQQLYGAWVSIILIDNSKIVLSGIVHNTTHNRMELTAVIEGINYVRKHCPNRKDIAIITDSQYVIDLPKRKEKIEGFHFKTKASKPIQNADLVKTFYDQLVNDQIAFEKIKAHQKKTDTINYNIEADILSRKLVRETIKNLDEL